MNEFNELIKDPHFIDFLNNTVYFGYQVTYKNIKFIIIMN